MKKSFFILALVVTLVSCQSKPSAENAGAGDAQAAAVASGAEYTINAASSSLAWKGAKPGGEHTGNVSVTDGNIAAENGKVVSGSFTIDLNTITCTDLTDAEMNGKLVGHLKSPDFFDVAQFPTAKFEVVSVTELPASATADASQATHEVTGNLIMKAATKSISFPARIVVGESSVTASAAPFAIDRTQWGVNYGSKTLFAELKDKFINDEMIISFDLTFNKVQ